MLHYVQQLDGSVPFEFWDFKKKLIKGIEMKGLNKIPLT